jgi:hypothetical protein
LDGSAPLTATINWWFQPINKTMQQSTTGAAGSWVNIAGQSGLVYNPPTGSVGTMFYRMFFSDPLPAADQVIQIMQQ